MTTKKLYSMLDSPSPYKVYSVLSSFTATPICFTAYTNAGGTITIGGVASGGVTPYTITLCKMTGGSCTPIASQGGLSDGEIFTTTYASSSTDAGTTLTFGINATDSANNTAMSTNTCNVTIASPVTIPPVTTPPPVTIPPVTIPPGTIPPGTNPPGPTSPSCSTNSWKIPLVGCVNRDLVLAGGGLVVLLLIMSKG